MAEKEPNTTAPDSPLESPDAVALHIKLRDWYQEEIERQRLNRFQMALDCDYYDGLQLSHEDHVIYNERGQAPLVYNHISMAVNWILGSEVKTRFDWAVRPRSEDDIAVAPIKTDLLKYVADVNRAGTKRSAAFKDQVVAGVGWLEAGITTDPAEEMIYVRSESWRNVIYDSRSVVNDMSDARFLFRHRWVDLDVAYSMFPERQDVLLASSKGANLEEREADTWFLGEKLDTGLTDGDSPATRYYAADTWSAVRNRRKRVRLMECWYRKPLERQILRGEACDGQQYDPNNELHQNAIANGMSAVINNFSMQMQTAIFCDEGMLSMGSMPYRHNKFPLIPLWCYRRDRDNAPYGMVRAMRDPQDDFNKRMSKALLLLSVNRVIFDEGAFGEDEEEARIEMARPDSFQSKKRGLEVKVEQGTELAPAQLRMAEMDRQHIEHVSGVTNEQRGMETNAIAYKAINARQQQGTVSTAPIFDRYREAFELQGRIVLSLIEQYYTMPRIVRITGMRGADRFLKINQRDPNDPMRYENDVTKSECDFIVDEQDFRATSRQALFDSVLELLGKLPPGLLPNYLDLAFDLLDIPQGEEMAKRARMMNGMDPPDGPRTPQEVQASQQRQQIQQMQMQLQMRSAIAACTKLEAEAKKAGSAAALLDAQTVLANVTALYEAMQGGQIIVTAPGATLAGDQLLAGAGFKDAGGTGIPLPYPSQLPAPQNAGSPGGDPTGQPPQAPQVPPPQAPGNSTDIPPHGMPQGAPNMHRPMMASGARAGIETVRADGIRQ